MTPRPSIAMLVLSSAALSATFGALAQNARTIPAQPRAQEEFIVVYQDSVGTRPSKMLDSHSTVADKRIDIKARIEIMDFSVPSTFDVLTVATVPAAGTYDVVGQNSIVYWGESDATATWNPAPRGQITVAAPVAESTPRWRTLAGLFARPDESGWGVHLAQGSSGRLFVTWYTYDDDNLFANNRAPSAWYVVSNGKWISSQQFRGVVYDMTGVPAGQPYEARHSMARTAGVATFRFIDEDHVEMSVEFAQASRYQTPQVLTRYRF
jgi:hypothetical protein